MKITNKHKMYIAVLGAGFAALLIDRTYFSPHSATAAPAPGLLNHSNELAAPVVTQENAGAPEVLIANKLKSIPPPDLNLMCDAFSPSQAWLSDVKPASGHEDPFAARHKLTAVMISQTGGGAIVDGQLIRVGQEIDGFTLVSVTRQQALFLSKTAKAVLPLEPS